MDFDENDVLRVKILNLYADCKKEIKVKQQVFLDWCVAKIQSGDFSSEGDFFEVLIRSGFDMAGIDRVLNVVKNSGGKISMANLSPTLFSLYKGSLDELVDLVNLLLVYFPYEKFHGELHRSDLVKRENGKSRFVDWFKEELSEYDKNPANWFKDMADDDDGEIGGE